MGVFRVWHIFRYIIVIVIFVYRYRNIAIKVGKYYCRGLLGTLKSVYKKGFSNWRSKLPLGRSFLKNEYAATPLSKYIELH